MGTNVSDPSLDNELAELKEQVEFMTDVRAGDAEIVRLMKAQVAELADENNLLREAVHGVERIILQLFANTRDKGEV